MLTRSIDADSFGPTFEEKIFINGKRVCIAFAIVALGISGLDLMNVPVLQTSAATLRDSRLNYAEIPGRLLGAIREISVVPEQSVTVAIPRDTSAPKIAAAPLPAQRFAAARSDTKIDAPVAPPKPAVSPVAAARIAMAAPPPAAPVSTVNAVFKSGISPVAELSDARHADAIEFAMASPAAMDSFKTVSFTPAMSARAMMTPESPSSSAMRRDESIKLASIAPAAMPDNNASEMPIAAASLPTSAAIPLKMVPLPTPAPGVPPPSPAQRLKLEGKEYAKAERCLANAIYFEARSEPVRGQQAVAQVIVNRAFSGFYPNDICGVVYQNANRHLSCQFTFACDGKSKAITERGHWARANRIAKQTLEGQIYVPEVAKSTHYHAVYVSPNWVREMKKNVRYGLHTFYRPFAWGNGEEEPVWGHPSLLTASAHTSAKKR